MSHPLGVSAPASANLNLAVQVLMGLALLVGMFLARRKMFRAHAACQSAVVLLNLIPITLFMLPVFRRGVAPALTTRLGEPFYAVSTAHALLGTLAELLGIYIILRAGTSLVPTAFRFENYKRWMRTELVLWWIVIALGLGTYFVWHSERSTDLTSPPPGASTIPTAPAPVVTISVRNFSFEPRELSIVEGPPWSGKTSRDATRRSRTTTTSSRLSWPPARSSGIHSRALEAFPTTAACMAAPGERTWQGSSPSNQNSNQETGGSIIVRINSIVVGLALVACCLVVSATPQKSATANVAIKNFEFQPKSITVRVGTTVIWTNDQGTHTVKADDGSFTSPTLSSGKTFSHKFTKKGTYGYHCSFHGSSGGHDMAGTVVVR